VVDAHKQTIKQGGKLANHNAGPEIVGHPKVHRKDIHFKDFEYRDSSNWSALFCGDPEHLISTKVKIFFSGGKQWLNKLIENLPRALFCSTEENLNCSKKTRKKEEEEEEEGEKNKPY